MEKHEKIAVSCKHITKSFGEEDLKVVALNGITLDIYRGELLMIVGPSGCGKTTLLSIIAGALNQDSGEISIYGHNPRLMGDEQKSNFRAKNIGFVFQSFNLLPTLTAAENVSLSLLINGCKEQEATERSLDMLSKIGLDSRTQSLPSQLSKGQQQRVAVARALVHNPRLIICDEPTSALDHASGMDIMMLLKGTVLNPGRTIIVVTHDKRIFEFADRMKRINDGVIENVDDTSNL